MSQTAEGTVLLCARMNAGVTLAFAEHVDLAVSMLLDTKSAHAWECQMEG